MVSLETIRNICAGRIAIGEPLARLTSFRIGGPVDMLIEPDTAGDVQRLVQYLQQIAFPFMVFGNGSNILVSDEGFRGVVINLGSAFSAAEYGEGVVTAGAGMRLAAFVDFCIAQGRAGVEMLAGIPGTLGGGIVMNAGAHGGEISDGIIDVTVIRNGVATVLTAAQCGFAYRDSMLRNDIVLSARFTLPEGDAEELRIRRRSLIERRNSTQPVGRPNAGSIFKNPVGMFAGQLIEEAGLKGMCVGGAEVSTLHANFITNTGGATARDVIELINIIRTQVYQHAGVMLELEIRLIGFHGDPISTIELAKAQ